MKKILLCTALTLPLLAHAGWVDADGKPRAQTESMRSDGDFGAMLILTGDDKQFRQTWNSSKQTPKLESKSSIKPGEKIASELLLQGCWPNSKTVCDVVVEYSVERPDGKKITLGSLPVWDEAPLSPGVLQLGRAGITLDFHKNDLAGEYKLSAVVKDKVAGRSLNLLARFTLTH
ncbi:MAG: hypothetical protein RL748_3602 [Pseudomonadota bacterium]